MTGPINNKQDANAILSRAQSNWENRISTPKGNPNAPRNINIDFSKAYQNNVQAQYQAYCQQCLMYGQTPMPTLQFMQMIQQGFDPMQSVTSDPLTTLNNAANVGKGLIGTISGFFNKSNNSKAVSNMSAEQKQELQTITQNYANDMKTKGEFDVSDLNKFVDAQIAALNPEGDGKSVPADKLAEHFSEILGEEVSDDMAKEIVKMTFGDVENISKEDLTKLYKLAAGKDNKITPEKLLEATLTKAEDAAGKAGANNVDKSMKAKGYTSTTKMINGEITGVFVKGDEVIPWSDTEKIQSIIDG